MEKVMESRGISKAQKSTNPVYHELLVREVAQAVSV